MVIFTLILLLCLTILFALSYNRKTYQRINHLLDCVLNREEIPYSSLKEGNFSALAGRIERIQNILEKQVSLAQEENEQIKSLVSNMSDQLKTPLANLSLYTEILESPRLKEEQKKQAVKKLKKQVEKLDWITGSLLKMIKLEQDVITFEAEERSIKETITDALDAVYTKIEKKGIYFSAELDQDYRLYHNRKWTAEVFVNILENAVKYTEKSGTIRISIRPYELCTEICFSDTGMGIRDQEITRIFRRFYRSPDAENIEGSGIGLYLSNLILEKEKGYMIVKSQYGKGSAFSVFLQNCKK